MKVFVILVLISLLVLNKKIFLSDESSSSRYYLFSAFIALIFLIGFYKVETSLSSYLTRFVHPLVHWIFGG